MGVLLVHRDQRRDFLHRGPVVRAWIAQRVLCDPEPDSDAAIGADTVSIVAQRLRIRMAQEELGLDRIYSAGVKALEGGDTLPDLLLVPVENIDLGKGQGHTAAWIEGAHGVVQGAIYVEGVGTTQLLGQDPIEIRAEQVEGEGVIIVTDVHIELLAHLRPLDPAAAHLGLMEQLHQRWGIVGLDRKADIPLRIIAKGRMGPARAAERLLLPMQLVAVRAGSGTAP